MTDCKKKMAIKIKSLPLHIVFCLFNPAEFSVPPFMDVLKHTNSAAPPEHPDHQQKVNNQLQNQPSSENKQHEAHHAGTNIVLSAAQLRGFDQVCSPQIIRTSQGFI